MTTKERLRKLLEDNRGKYVSGEEIASSLKISRTAVWKAIRALREDGYEIDAVRNRGYRLPEETDVMSAEGIRHYMADGVRSGKLRNDNGQDSGPDAIIRETDLRFERVVTSTNTLLKDLAAAGAKEGTILAAAEQTAGKGRVGRSFYSPEGTGVYLSILLRPENYDASRASRFTTMAAVAACEAIEEIGDKPALIKWVNDVYVGGRKVVGILTEASLDLESGFLDYAVLGIGFNVYEPEGGFPEEIRDRAGAILTQRSPDAKNRLAAAFIRRFMDYYGEEKAFAAEGTEGEKDCSASLSYIQKYRGRSFVVGKDIDVLEGGRRTPATALAVDEQCRLIVRYGDGREEALSAGEVSIRVPAD